MRPELTDKYQNFRFHVVSEPKEMIGFESSQGGEAGFQSVTTPELSLDPVEYREGTSTFTKKYAGVPTFGDISMIRGLTAGDTSFFAWIKAAATSGEYRTDLRIKHFHRSETPNSGAAGATTPSKWGPGKRQIRAFECIPTRVKADGDLEATASDVSLTEVDVACEYIEVFDENAP